MKTLCTLLFAVFSLGIQAQTKKIIVNFKGDTLSPLMNMRTYIDLANEVFHHRHQRLVTWKEFQKKALEPNTLILDTRSARMYKALHLKGAKHLNFSEFDMISLEKLTKEYAGKNTQILIYCNNNFKAEGVLEQIDDYLVENANRYLMSKAVRVDDYNNAITQGGDILEYGDSELALNIPTYINLYGYGYKNVFELDELLDVNDPSVVFEGTEAESTKDERIYTLK